MSPCKNIIHPFQNDPGTSQRQRLMPELEAGAPKIDGRTWADLLDYFTRLARHIRYYDKELAVSDWQPFFNKSIPFNLASISKYDAQAIEEKLGLYKTLFARRPGKNTLQLLIHFMYYSTIYRINSWHLAVKGSGLPFERMLQNLVSDRLLEPVNSFIGLANAAAREHCTAAIDFSVLAGNSVWGLQPGDLRRLDSSIRPRRGRRNRLTGLMNAFTALWPAFIEAVKLLGTAAEDSIEDSLFNQPAELKQQHSPHLALLLAFLKLFQHLQSDLNGFTRKHLDFFFRDVLRLVPRAAAPDKAHIVFEIQKQLDSYLLKKGLLVKDAKDKNNQEILFELDDELVVNKAQVEDVRTLFLHMHPANDNIELSLTEGVYMAPAAAKADGLKKDFTGDPANWPTLGAQYSKFIDTGKTTPELYPHARIGFVLASPVLLLNEGRRSVSIQLYCRFNRNCLGPGKPNVLEQFLPALQTAMGQTYIIVTKDLIAQAEKKGISEATISKLKGLLDVIPKDSFCPGEPVLSEEPAQVVKMQWDTDILNTSPANEHSILKELFTERRVCKIYFSGKSAWVEPSRIDLLAIEPKGADYLVRINVTLEPDKPAVTFFDKAALKEDFATTSPLVKIELDNAIRIGYPGMAGSTAVPEKCCFANCPASGRQHIALYQFFRQLTVTEGTAPNTTQIEVSVCGLKSFIVQNNENIMDVNGPVYPFGTRPKVADFELINPPIVPTPNPNLIGPDFYIGSQEVFCKKWSDVRVNLNWKDKPSNFKDYYRAYYTNPADPNNDYGLLEDNFKVNLAFLRNGAWVPEVTNRRLFDTRPATSLCPDPAAPFDQTIRITYNNALLHDPFFSVDDTVVEKLSTVSRNGFIRINLRDQDFLHKDYAFVLARQMMAFGRFPDALIEGAVYVDEGNSVIVFRSLGRTIVELKDEIFDSQTAAETARNIAVNLRTVYDAAISGPPPADSITNAERNNITPRVHNTATATQTSLDQANTTKNKLTELQSVINFFDLITGEIVKKLRVLIPNEPWTPVIKNMSLDYVAAAKITDIDLIHLYPYENTHKEEQMALQPALFPTHCDEGNLFIGLKQLVPGTNVNLLFQLAEATANSEAGKADTHWHYLAANEWKPLRKGFEVLDDATNGLTTSGIVKLSIPGNITADNTVLPKELHWIKVSASKNVIAVSETIGIHTQAIRASFVNTPAHDQLRLAAPLEANKLSKLQEADASVKKAVQPYASFGGSVPEEEGTYYVRASEWLRHKGRAIQKFDYERLVLDTFPEIYKVKCINHDFRLSALQYRLDVNAAPGYVMVAVIPDLNKLKSGQSFEPKAPLSLLEKIQAYLKKRTSPFARLAVVNPRYEPIDLCLTVQLVKGKDKVFYKKKLEDDLRLFLAPWAVGEFEKLSFGQCVNRSDIVRFIEGRDYVDYIICLRMMFEKDCESGKTAEVNELCPLTPRSILVGGFIDVCIPESDCEDWGGDDQCSKRYAVTEPECRQLPPIH